MSHKNPPFHVLTLHLSSERVGFAVFDAPKHLALYGSRKLPTVKGTAEHSGALIEILLHFSNLITPDHIIVNPQFKNAIANIAGNLRISNNIRVIEDTEVDNAFATFAQPTQLSIVAWTALIFPELQPRFLRINLKAHDRTLFRAVALGVAYMTRFGEYSMSISNGDTFRQAKSKRGRSTNAL